jgi:hypothetical protein
MLSLRGRLKHSTSGTEIDRRRLGDRWEINIAPDLGRKSKLIIEASRDGATRAGARIAHVCDECRDTISAINTERGTYICLRVRWPFYFSAQHGPAVDSVIISFKPGPLTSDDSDTPVKSRRVRIVDASAHETSGALAERHPNLSHP